MQFSRTVAPDTSKGPALIAFMQQNRWKKLTIVTSTEPLWLETGLAIAKQLKATGMEVLQPAAFESGNFSNAMLSEIKRSGNRINLVLAYGADQAVAALKSHQKPMTNGWAWLVLSDEGMARTEMAGWLFFRPSLGSDMQAFAKQVSDYSKSHFNTTVSPDAVDLTYSTALYDAILLYAHAATQVMSEGHDVHNGEAVTAALRSTVFTGVRGSAVELDSNGDRIDSYEVMNYVLEADGRIGR